MTWLVTSGAGYIGAHVVRALTAAGLGPVVLDDLSSGHAAFVPQGVRFVRASLLGLAGGRISFCGCLSGGSELWAPF